MVIKVKVSDVAAGFGVQNKEVLDLLAQCGAAKKSPSTVLEEGELNALFDRITKTHSVENFDKFYALRSNKPKSQAPQQKKGWQRQQHSVQSSIPYRNSSVRRSHLRWVSAMERNC